MSSRRNCQCLRRGFTQGELRGHAAAGNRCGAPVGPESGIANGIIPDTQPDLHALAATAAARGISIRFGNAFDIMGMQDMLDRGGGIDPLQPLSQTAFHFIHASIIKGEKKKPLQIAPIFTKTAGRLRSEF